MKKILASILTIALMSLTLPIVSAAEKPQPKILLHNIEVIFPDEQPFLDENNRVQVPARALAEALGATVEWCESSQTVTIHKYIYLTGNVTITFNIGKSQYNVVGGPFEGKKNMDTKAIIKNGRLFLPVRYLGEELYSKVYWDQRFKRVHMEATNTKVKKDPVVGFIQVEIDTKFVEYGLGILVHDEPGIVKERMDIAEKMIAERYGSSVAKQLMDYARKKQTREYKLPKKEFRIGGKEVTVSGYDISTEITFFKH